MSSSYTAIRKKIPKFTTTQCQSINAPNLCTQEDTFILPYYEK